MLISLGLVLIVLGALLLERFSLTLITRSPQGRAWIVGHRLFHPNSISFIRMPMGIISILLWCQGWHIPGLLWFAVWMITDLSDGTIARNCNLQTESGKWLDPLSDKCMYFPPLIYFAWMGLLAWQWVWILILIDSLGQASRLVVKKKAANSFGKAKTAFITILLSVTALKLIGNLTFITPGLLLILTKSCTLLAFLSLYCKVIPDLWYANSLSLANFLCGLAAIQQIYIGHPIRAFVLVFMGQFFDLFDGRMARKFGSTPHGAVFDDMADGTSFGVAIACLIYAELGQDWLSAVVAVVYLTCVVYRLLRFLKPTMVLPRGVFQGLPSPAGAMMAGSSALMVEAHLALGLGLVLFASFLMISNIPYRHFGQKIWPSLPNSIKLLSFVLLLSLVNIVIADKNYKGAFSLICFVLIMTYLLLGLDYAGFRAGLYRSGNLPVSSVPKEDEAEVQEEDEAD